MNDVLKSHMTDFTKEINRSLRGMLDAEMKTIKDEYKEIKESMEFINGTFEMLQIDHKANQEKIKKLEEINKLMQSTINSLQSCVNQLEQNSRANNIEIQCMPESKSENLVTLLKKLGSVIDCEVADEHTALVTRIAKLQQDSLRPRSIIVEFKDIKLRDAFLAASINFNKKHPDDKLNSAHLGLVGKMTPIFVAEHLSVTNKVLHAAARRTVKKKGYGHIAPKTQTGKVVTIFYAILGIPLMLLCLSNIGDVMASSFRFLYWRVCCYVCTRPPKRRHRHHHTARRSVRASRRRRPVERAHSDTDFKYRDSGYSSGKIKRTRPPSATLPSRTRSQPPPLRSQGRDLEAGERSPVRFDKYSRDKYEEEDEEFPKISLPLQDLQAALKDLDNHQLKINSKSELRSKSLPRPAKSKPEFGPRRDFDEQRHYELDDGNDIYEMHDLHDVDYENFKERKALEQREPRRIERDDYSYRDRGYDPEDEDYEESPRTRRTGYNQRMDRGRSEFYERDIEDYDLDRRRGRRARSAMYDCERRQDSGPDRWGTDDRLGVGDRHGRPRRLRRLYTVDDTERQHHRYTPSPDRDDWSDELPPIRRRPPADWGSRQSDLHPSGPVSIARDEIKPVPIWLCVFLVASYIVAGTFLFKRWEGWAYLDAAYFCFITLTTIGFGDFVPAQGQSGEAADAVHSIALCSLYLLFGIALLAMSFNLVQEEVRANVAALATRLGIIKPRDIHDLDY
ncbi:unnamed protein product [Parnassius apollo]|uniref:(apollo) hypothetical protein n=1 Tax=Parnassius apollo TaxID=110799 RepID=A0A8S3Y638_PARAO|nr:unnamed protein product [Parnassius apollo]